MNELRASTPARVIMIDITILCIFIDFSDIIFLSFSLFSVTMQRDCGPSLMQSATVQNI